MSNFKIGTSDRGVWDRQDNLNMGKTPLKKGLTAEAAQAYAKTHGGAESLVREKDGTFSVYAVSTSESGKEILNKDFDNGSIDLTSNVASLVHADKAYIMTDTNYLRTLEHASYQLDNLDQNFATVDVSLKLEDIDGLDQSSAQDLKGKLNGQVTIDRAAIEYGLAEGEIASHLDLELASFSKDQYLQVKASYGIVGLGSITIKPSGTGLKVNVGGLAGGLAGAADWAGKKIGLDPEKAVDSIIEKMAKGMGMKVVSSGLTEYTLEPDLKNNPLLKSFPIAEGQSITVESITVDPKTTGFKIQSGGDLILNIGNAEVVASTNSKGSKALKDAEGSDQIELKLKAQLRNDQQVSAEAETQLSVHILPAEAKGLQAELKKYGVSAPLASGDISVTDIAVKTQFKIGQEIQIEQTKTGQFAFQDLDLEIDKTKISLGVEGHIQGRQDGKKIHLNAEKVALSGEVNSPEGKLTLDELSFGGELTLDQNKPNQLHFELAKDAPLNIDGKLTLHQLGATARIQDLQVTHAEADIDLANGQLEINGNSSQSASISAKGLGFGKDLYLGQLKMTGNLKAELNSGSLDIDAKKVSFWGTFDQTKLDHFEGSGKIHYDAAQGLSIRQANVSMKGSIQDVSIERLKGRGDIAISNSGALEIKNGRNIDFQSTFPGDLGLKIKGDFDLQTDGAILKAQTKGKAAVLNIDGEIQLENFSIKGETIFDTQKSLLEVSAQKGEVLELPSGRIGDLSFKDVKLSEAHFKADLWHNNFEFAPNPGKSLHLEGVINGVHIASLDAEGTIKVQANKNHVTFAEPVTIKMPEYGLKNISTDGPVEFWVDPKGLLHLNAQGTTLNGDYEGMTLKDVKIHGEMIFDPNKNLLTLAGQGNEGLTIEGEINDFPLSLSSKGQVSFKPDAKGLEIEGRNVEIKGLLDGFVLESGQDTSGKIHISNDGTDISINELDFDVRFEDFEVQNHESLLTRTKEGYELNLSGQVELKQEHLYSLLDKLDQRQGLSNQVRQSLKTIETQLKQSLSGFDKINADYDDMKISFDNDFNFKGIQGSQKASVDNMQVRISSDKNKPAINLGKVDVTTELDITPEKTSIPSGSLAFDFTSELRGQLAETIAAEMKAAGFEDVEMTISPDGDVDISNATYKYKTNSSGFLGLGQKKERVRNISAQLKLDIELEGSQVKVKLEDFALKNLIYNIVAKLAMNKEEMGTMASSELAKQDIKLDYDRAGDVFSLDLNETLQTHFSNDMDLQSVELKDGRINIQYAVGQK